jgi:hypothetical protein
MAKIIEVYVKGESGTPSRFWDLALRTTTMGSFVKDYVEDGFFLHKGYSKEYEEMSEDMRKKVKFKYINGEEQTY